MADFFIHHNFFTLALLFALPGTLIWLSRPDLRRVIARIVPFALPFACTEFLFYPSYWEPVFLFDLGKQLGFGIEDFIFVAGLAAFTTTVYAFFCNRAYTPPVDSGLRAAALRALVLFACAGTLLLITLAIAIPVIYGACLVMLTTACVIIQQRHDLRVPALIGGCLSTAIYFLLCLAAAVLMPGFFKNTWHTDKFLNIFFLGVPIEELLYGFSSGFAGTVFYPYVFAKRFIIRTTNEAL